MSCLLITVAGVERHELRYIIDGAYKDAKLGMLEQQLMFGGFHMFNNRPSAWNPEFFPMRTPVPVFAFRRMTRVDWKSLRESDDYLEVYTRFFGPPPLSES
jgi:hypothetical protein